MEWVHFHCGDRDLTPVPAARQRSRNEVLSCAMLSLTFGVIFQFSS